MHAHSSHPLILFHAYFPRLFFLFFTQKTLSGKGSPTDLIAAYLWSRRLYLFDPWLLNALPVIQWGLDAAY